MLVGILKCVFPLELDQFGFNTLRLTDIISATRSGDHYPISEVRDILQFGKRAQSCLLGGI